MVFTSGIMPGPERRVSAEGIEMDMAVSTLSRRVALKELLPRLKPEGLRDGLPGFWAESRA